MDPVDNEKAVVEEVGFSDFNAVDKDLEVGDGLVGLRRRGGDGKTAVGGQGFNLRAEGQVAEEMKSVKARDGMFLEEKGEGTGWASEEGGVCWGENGGRSGEREVGIGGGVG